MRCLFPLLIALGPAACDKSETPVAEKAAPLVRPVARPRLDSALDRARRAAEQNPGDAERLAAVAYITGEMGAIDQAMPWLERAIAVAPAAGSLQVGLAALHRQMGDLDAAERVCRQALASSDARTGCLSVLGYIALARGQRAQAERWADSLNRESSKWTYAGLRWGMGELAPTERLLQHDSARRHGPYAISWAYIQQQHGRDAEAKRFIGLAEQHARQRLDRGDQTRRPYGTLSHVHALRGERERALRMIRLWIDHGLRDPDELLLDPIFAPLHRDPEFQRIIEGMREHQASLRVRLKGEGSR